MKIYSKKFKEDFESYYHDLEISVASSLQKHTNGGSPNIFKVVYPLFVMLETLSNPDYFLDPSARIELDQCLESEKKEHIKKARRKLATASMKMSNELRTGLANEMFTPYFEELYSDSFLLLNQYYLNNYRGCYLYLRCILENAYKHIYYLDHKQEFNMVASGISEYSLDITPQYLREYLEKTAHLRMLNSFNFEFKNLKECTSGENTETLFGLNEGLYSKTSAFVHPSGPTYMSKFKSNSDLIYEEGRAQEIVDTTKRIINMLIIFLVLVHFHQVSRFNEYEKNLILCGFDKQTKKNVRMVLGL